MAGMPNSLINRANEIIAKLEASRDNQNGNEKINADDTSNLQKIGTAAKMQLSIFDAHTQTFEDIRTALNNTDINRLTPVEALLKLQEIKGMVK
jgi:DNA mismatch repair protein MutS